MRLIESLLTGGAFAALMVAGGASAQPVSTTTVETAAEPQAFGDIVVTAQRRVEKQSQVPFSITAFTTESLAKTRKPGSQSCYWHF